MKHCQQKDGCQAVKFLDEEIRSWGERQVLLQMKNAQVDRQIALKKGYLQANYESIAQYEESSRLLQVYKDEIYKILNNSKQQTLKRQSKRLKFELEQAKQELNHLERICEDKERKITVLQDFLQKSELVERQYRKQQLEIRLIQDQIRHHKTTNK